ncbi:hypothetical protein ACFL35_13125 [Candidatus Riflebacteria bacterium]
MGFNRPVFLLQIITLLFLIQALEIGAAPADFEFYYQRVYKKVELKPVPKPEKGFFNKIKWAGKKVGFFAKSAWNGVSQYGSLVRQQFFPKSNGNVQIYSRSKPGVTWKAKRYKITSESQLLKVMGVTDPAKMSSEQKGVLHTYRFAHSKSIKDRNELAYQSKLRVFFTESGDYARDETFSDDFWPHSRGNLINIGDNYFSYREAEESGKTLFAHEFSHFIDKTQRETDSYGPDKAHYVNEITAPRAAWSEGWAIFNEMILSEDEKEYVFSTIKRLKLEKDTAGKYEYFDVNSDELKGQALLDNEGYVAACLYNLYNELPAGEAKILQAFKATNQMDRNFSIFIQKMLAQHPNDAAKIIEIVDKTLRFKLSKDELSAFFGSSSSLSDYIQNVRDGLFSKTSLKTFKEKSQDDSRIKAGLVEAQETPGTQAKKSGELTLKQAFEEFIKAKTAYKEAKKQGLSQDKIRDLKKVYIEKMAAYKEIADRPHLR